jgi:flagellar assembly protein FliH
MLFRSCSAPTKRRAKRRKNSPRRRLPFNIRSAITNAALLTAKLQIHAHTQEFQRNLDHHGVVLAMRIAEKIIGRAVADAKTVQHMIAQTLLQVPMKRGLKIRLSPTDAAALLELREKHGASCSAVPEDAEIIPDPAITKGGCIIDSMLGRVDARIETQLELLDRALNDRPIGAGVNNG